MSRCRFWGSGTLKHPGNCWLKIQRWSVCDGWGGAQIIIIMRMWIVFFLKKFFLSLSLCLSCLEGCGVGLLEVRLFGLVHCTLRRAPPLHMAPHPPPCPVAFDDPLIQLIHSDLHYNVWHTAQQLFYPLTPRWGPSSSLFPFPSSFHSPGCTPPHLPHPSLVLAHSIVAQLLSIYDAAYYRHSLQGWGRKVTHACSVSSICTPRTLWCNDDGFRGWNQHTVQNLTFSLTRTDGLNGESRLRLIGSSY